jgi:hypothetical protein
VPTAQVTKNTCSELTITDAAITATDYLILKGPTTAGLQAIVKSTAAGSAVVRLCNGTAGNITPPSGDVIAYVIVR